MIQVGRQGRSLGMIQARRQGRWSKEVKLGEKSRMEEVQVDHTDVDDQVVEDRNKLEEPKQVTEDQNEVTGMEVQEDAIQDGDLYDVIARINHQGQEHGAEKQQNQPQKTNNAVVETGFSVEDQTKVIIGEKVGKEWNGNVKEKLGSVGLRRSGRRKYDVSDEENLPCEQHKVGGAKEQYPPQKQYNVTWIGRGEHMQGKGGCVKQRRSGSKQHVSKERLQPCEQLEEGIKEKGHQRKQYNVMWIGRGVRKLKEAGRDLLKEQSDDEVTELEDDVSEEEDAAMIGNDAEVDEHVEGLKQKEEKGETNVEHNRPEENQQYDIFEKQILGKEQLMNVADAKIMPCKQHERVGMEQELEVPERLQLKQQLCNEVLPETLQVDDKVMEDQYLLMARSEAQEVGVIKEWSGKQKQVKGESMEQSGSQLQQNDLSGEQVDLQKRSKEETDDKFHTQGQQQRGSMEQDELQKQEVQIADEQDSVMMQCEAQVTVAGVEEQHDDAIQEQIWPEKQPKKGTKEEFQPHELQKGGGTEQQMLAKQVEMVGKPLQDEEIQKGRVLMDEERDVITIQYEAPARVGGEEKTEPEEQHDYLTEEQVETKEQSKELHDDVSEEPIHPLELCDERTEKKLQSSGQDWLEDGEVESAEERPQQKEQRTEVNQKEIGLHLRMNQGETEVRRACVEQNESEEQQYVTEKHVQPQDSCTGGNKFQLHEQQQRDVMEQVQLEEVEVAEDGHQQEQLNKVKGKDVGLMHGVSDRQQDSVMTQAEAEVEGNSEEHNKSEMHQDQLEKRETVTSEVRPQQEGQHDKGLPEESELMNNVTEVLQDLMMIQGESQLEGTSVEHNEVQEDDTVVERVQPHKLFMEGTIEGQKDENEAGLEKSQSEEYENGVTVQRYQPQEQCVERKERNRPCIQQTEISEKDALQEKSNAVSNENLAPSGSKLEGLRALSCNSSGVKKMRLPDHKHQAEQRRPLRQGLRSSCKKEEAAPNVENQVELVTPVRRSLRPRKTISEVTEGPDRSKEQLKHSGCARPSKRKPKIADAIQVSRLQKTRRTDL